jgi:hypothetical protein
MNTLNKKSMFSWDLIIIIIFFLILGNCSENVSPKPDSLDIVGDWELYQHMWINGDISDNHYIDLLQHLEFNVTLNQNWYSFQIILDEYGSHNSNYNFCYSHPETGGGQYYYSIEWDTLNSETLKIEDGFTDPQFKYFLNLDEDITVLSLEDSAGTWIFHKNP